MEKKIIVDATSAINYQYNLKREDEIVKSGRFNSAEEMYHLRRNVNFLINTVSNNILLRLQFNTTKGTENVRFTSELDSLFQAMILPV